MMTISDEEKAKRSFVIRNVRASFALEGIVPDEEMKALEERYIHGEFADAKELDELTRTHLRKKYAIPPKSFDATLALLAVDNIKMSPAGMALMHRVDRGEITTEEAIEAVKQRAIRYGKGG
jgi:hypothetical protein